MSRRRRRRKPPSLLRRIFTNRRDPNSSWVFLADIIGNVKEEWHCFVNRVPRGSRLYWHGSKIRSHSTIRRY